MAKERPADRSSVSTEELERRFRAAFGREMTAEERRFLKLASLLLENELGIEEIEEEKETQRKGTAA